MAVSGIDLGKYKLGWSDSTDDYVYTPTKGINEDIVKEISHRKSEPEWMTKFRLNALKRFERKPMLDWFAKNMPDIDFDDIYYYLKPTDGQVVDDWDMLPEGMKETYEKLGIPEAERKFLAGVTAQYESEVVYHKNRDDLAATGVLFTDMDTTVREYPEEHPTESGGFHLYLRDGRSYAGRAEPYRQQHGISVELHGGGDRIVVEGCSCQRNDDGNRQRVGDAHGAGHRNLQRVRDGDIDGSGQQSANGWRHLERERGSIEYTSGECARAVVATGGRECEHQFAQPEHWC